MSQRLTIRTRKDGKSKGVAIRKNPSTTRKNGMMQTLFQMAYQQHKRKQNGKSKS